MVGGARSQQPSVILVEDHQLFREGVRTFLSQCGIQVVGEADNAADAVALAAETRPGVALIDLRLSDKSGIDATRRILTVSPETCVVVLSASADERDVFEALAAGACGYLLKDCPPEEIAHGVRAAADSGAPFSPAIGALLLERLRTAATMPADVDGDETLLTERELEVLLLIVDGKDNAEIAEDLVISQHTVKNHVSRILDKLEVDNRIQAAVYAVRKDLG
jgi:DNA-binding NarL/FixJ family response regulator